MRETTGAEAQVSEQPTTTVSCRFCGAELRHLVVDLGAQPLANSYLTAADLSRPEPVYPLRLFVCEECFLIQLDEVVDPQEVFGNYAYFSSYSDSWLEHARAYCEVVVERFGLGQQSRVVEVGSNDGYLLQYFLGKGIDVLGIDPAANVAQAAVAKGIPTLVRFFDTETALELAAEGRQADLVVGNNVLAHVPGLNDFVEGLKILLKDRGVATLEFPHLLRLLEGTEFDTIYHEHFSYFSFITAERVFAAHGLVLFDVEELPTHGGSLRLYASRMDGGFHRVTDRVARLREREYAAGLVSLDAYDSFAERVAEAKRALVQFLSAAKRGGKSVVGYGAPAKGNTLLNYCGLRADLLEYTVDRSPHKQGCFLPGTRIPIYHPEKIRETKPDYVLILPWNLKDEVMQQLACIRDWGGRFVLPIPQVRVLP